MLRNIFANSWILGGIAFFAFLILIVGGCLFWYHNITSQSEKEAAETEQFARQWEKDQQAKPKAATDPETASPKATTDSDTPDAENERSPVPDRTELSKAHSNVPTEIAETAEVRMSPYGFGPYPEVPEGFSRPVKFPSSSPEHELMTRVEIKLYKQGIDVKGATLMNGLVFPIIKGQVYVEWDSYEGPSGVVRYIRRTSGFPTDINRLQEIQSGKEKHKSVTEADIPSDIKIVSFNDGGIDPYTFLDLPKGEK